VSSHLTISYTSKTAAGSAPAVSPAAGESAADGPLGFLAALLDQLVAGAKPATEEASVAGTENTIPGLLDIALDSTTETRTSSASDSQSPIADLTGLLGAMQAQLDNGESPSADQLKRLSDRIEALSAAPGGTGAPALASDLDGQLLALSESLAATAPALAQDLEALATQSASNASASEGDDAGTIADIIRALLGQTDASLDETTGSRSAATPQDQLLQILSSLGLSAQSATGTASDAPASPSSVPPDLLRLSTQLTKLSSELGALAPDLAKKLDAVATRLVSADADPTLLAQLGSAASDQDGASLDKLVQSLLDTKPVPAAAPAGPTIAATAKLEVPAAIMPAKAVEPQPLAPPTAATTAELTLAAAAEPAADPALAKIETKAAAIVVDATKPDPAKADTTAATQPQPVAPIASATTPRALPAPYQPVANPINMGQMAFEMVRQVHQGTSRFTIRLDPPELGRVDVRMQVDQTGTINARLTVERAETLDLFQRDQRSLERALAQAGLDSSKTNLEFSLRQNPFANMSGDQRSSQQHFSGNPRFMAAEQNASAPTPSISLYRGTASAGGVNILA